MNPEPHKKASKWVANIGGVFLYSKHPQKLSAWYQKVLDISFQISDDKQTFYADFPYENNRYSTCLAILQLQETVKSSMPFMVSYRIADMEAFLAHIESLNIEISDIQEDPMGLFAWLEDLDGNSIEIWQPFHD